MAITFRDNDEDKANFETIQEALEKLEIKLDKSKILRFALRITANLLKGDKN